MNSKNNINIAKGTCEICIVEYCYIKKIKHLENNKEFRKEFNLFLEGVSNSKSYSDIAICKALNNLNRLEYITKIEKGKYKVNERNSDKHKISKT